MTKAEFLLAVAKNAERVTEYAPGGDGTNGKCDCIGLVIGAVRLAGEKWTGTHGSNYAARSRVESLRKIGSVAQLRLGDLVFKGRKPGDAGYSLPGRYQDGGDTTDYYHVGVVTRLSPLQITHCTGVPGGIRRDTALGTWRYAGQLNLIGEDKPMEAMYQAVVRAENGKPVNLREAPSVSAKLIRTIPVGTRVEVLEEYSDSWSRIRYNGADGYMMCSFLLRADGNDEDDTVSVSRKVLQSVYDALRGMLGQGAKHESD